MDIRNDVSPSMPFAPASPRAPKAPGKWWTPVLAGQLALIALLLAWNYWHVLDRLYFLWRTRADWSHGFIIPLFALYYLYLRRDRMPLALPTGSAARWVGAGVLLASFMLYFSSIQLQQAYPQ